MDLFRTGTHLGVISQAAGHQRQSLGARPHLEAGAAGPRGPIPPVLGERWHPRGQSRSRNPQERRRDSSCGFLWKPSGAPRRYHCLAVLYRRHGHELLIRGGDGSSEVEYFNHPTREEIETLTMEHRRKQMETVFRLVQGCLRQLRKDRLYPGERKRRGGR